MQLAIVTNVSFLERTSWQVVPIHPQSHRSVHTGSAQSMRMVIVELTICGLPTRYVSSSFTDILACLALFVDHIDDTDIRIMIQHAALDPNIIVLLLLWVLAGTFDVHVQ